MDVVKIGKFIAKNRKEKELTQEQLAEKLGVTAKTISRWENGNYMPDISLLKPLSELLNVTLNDLLSGEIVEEEHYQEKVEETIQNTIDYTNQKIKEKSNSIGIIFTLFGVLLSITAMTILPSESSWGSIYSVLGCILSLIGISRFTKKLTYGKRLICHLSYFILYICTLFIIDYIGVVNIRQAPRFSYSIETGDTMIMYKTPFYHVYRMNRNTKNEYYIIDTKKAYTEDTVPNSPFNRDKAGIENLIKYKNHYVGNNSNTGNLIGNLPLSEYDYVMEIDSENLGLIINYHITDWYVGENQYLEKCLLYNSVSLFSLIDNVQELTFNFSGKSYRVSRKQIEDRYPNYHDIVANRINKENFNRYLESKMNDEEFVRNIFDQIFANSI